MTKGFSEAGFIPVLAVDSDDWAVKSYNANFAGAHGIVRDLTKALPDYPEADLLIGGPPCQGFSQLGKQDPDHPLNSLWYHYLEAIEEIRPSVFVMENVPQLLASPHYLKFKASLPSNYNVECKVLNAADFGVPQVRRRAIVIGSNIAAAETLFPVPDHSQSKGLFDASPWQNVESAFAGVPREPSYTGDTPWDPNEPKSGLRLHVGRKPTNISLERYRAVPEGGNRFDLERNLPHLTPPCWIRKKTGGTDLFGRLWWDRPSVTIRTEFYKPEKGRYLHPCEHRPITIWEAAKLQTIPENFCFIGSKSAVARQIGNAVPPLLAERIAERIAKVLSETRFESVFSSSKVRIGV